MQSMLTNLLLFGVIVLIVVGAVLATQHRQRRSADDE